MLRTSRINIYKETEQGIRPSSPKTTGIKLSSYAIKTEQKSDNSKLLGNGGQPSKNNYGTYTYSGSIGFELNGNNFPIILQGVVGKATKTNLTNTAHQTNHAYTKDTVIKYDATHNYYYKQI